MSIATQGFGSLVGAVGPASKFSAPSTIPVSGSYMARVGERVLYTTTGAPYAIFAPSGPAQGEQFAVKNIGGPAATVIVSGNGKGIENATGAYALGPTAAVHDRGVAVTWEFGATGWIAVATRMP